MARNFFTGGSMPSFDTFLFFQKHLAIQNTWMINGVHYSKVSLLQAIQDQLDRPEISDQLEKLFFLKIEFRHWKPGLIC